jgi:hypothetical protein
MRLLARVSESPAGAAAPSAVIERKAIKPVAVIRVSKIWPPSPHRRAATAAAVLPVTADDGLEAFGSESEPVDDAPPVVDAPPAVEEPAFAAVSRLPVRVAAILVPTMVFSAALGAAGVWQYNRRVAGLTRGTLTIQTVPAGEQVLIGGSAAGVTPLTLDLAPGSYRVQVGPESNRRDLPVTVVSGGTTVHQLEFSSPPAPAEPARTGALDVRTNLPKMSVLVDGVDRGIAPLTVDNMSVGEHSVVLRGDGRSIKRTVSIKANETFALDVATVENAAVSPGWVTISAPIKLDIREEGQLIGTTEAAKLMLAAGDHQIELANASLGYRTVKHVTVSPGKTASIAVDLPSAPLSINASPWAEVWIDGVRAGETPLANLSTRIGSHDVVFKHPQHGEHRETILVTLLRPAQIGVDMRRKEP